MRFNASRDSCSESVLIEASEPRGPPWGPVTGAAVSGASLALIAAALLFLCHRKQLFSVAAPVRNVAVILGTDYCEEYVYKPLQVMV